MVYLRGLFVRIFIITIFMVAVVNVETASTKIAYKKPIYGKSNAIKEKRLKLKTAETSKRMVANIKTTTQPPLAGTTVEGIATIATTPISEIHSNTETLLAATNVATSGEQQDVEFLVIKKDLKHTENIEPVSQSSVEEKPKESNSADAEISNTKEESAAVEDEEAEVPTLVELPPPTTTTATTTTTESNLPVPCTCGVFLSSQIKRGSNEQPQGVPVIVNELDRNFPCNPIGQKQCQTKCLETIVQHLPNSASILCATLNRDCRKERAYLFIKNCHNQWWNTSLTAGREYCCRNGQPYPCPMM